MCRVNSIKLKNNPCTYRWKNYYGRKVSTICATDVEWLEVELAPKPKRILDQEKNILELPGQINCLKSTMRSEKSKTRIKQLKKKKEIT